MNSRRPPIVAAICAIAAGLALAPLASAQGSLALTVLPQTTQVKSGELLRVVIIARSTGTTAATGISVCLTPPVQLPIIRARGATRTGSRACFTVGDLEPGVEATRAVEVRAASMRAVTVRMRARATSACACSATPLAWSPQIRITPAAGRPRVTG